MRRLKGDWKGYCATTCWEINDNGFLPEGSSVQGYDASRKPGAYSLVLILDVADKTIQRDPANVGIFVQVLNDFDPTVQRWAATGLVMLAGTKDIASAEGFADPPRETLGECVDHNVDPFVRVPAAEALARLDGRSRGYEILVELIAPANERAVRIEALNALTFLDHGQLTPFRAQIAEAAGDPDGCVRGAGRYLLFRLNGSYTPESAIFLWELFEGTHNR